jgi:adenine-specific DNA-methyltransferase
VLALQKKLEEMEAERKAAANRARAQKLIRRMEEQNISFGGDEEREKELARLAGLSDDAFAATETAVDRMIRANAEKAEKEKPENAKASGKEQAKAGAERDESPMRSNAGVRPKDVDDRKNSLEDKLKNGFMAAYRHRVASAAGEPVANN